jgi:hypothetical protein
MSGNVRADAKFLRRIFLTMIVITIATGIIVGLSTVQAMSTTTDTCVFFCSQ